jgi:hypothetical protein
MELDAGENACRRLPAFMSLKMEMPWKRNPIGRATYYLPTSEMSLYQDSRKMLDKTKPA